MQSVHDLRAAVATGSAVQVAALLSPAVVFHSPASDAPAVGVARVAQVLALAGRIYGPLVMGPAYGNDESAVGFFTAHVGDHEVQVCYRVDCDADRLIERIDALMRPLPAMQELVRRMMQALASEAAGDP
jgi:hypothetical protein